MRKGIRWLLCAIGPSAALLGMHITINAALAGGEKLLGLPALGGLFAAEMIPDLESSHYQTAR
jgi:hypothetical protein